MGPEARKVALKTEKTALTLTLTLTLTLLALVRLFLSYPKSTDLQSHSRNVKLLDMSIALYDTSVSDASCDTGRSIWYNPNDQTRRREY